MWMPALAALLATLVSGEGLRARLLRPDPARNWKYDLQGWLLPAVLTGVGAITYFLLFPGRLTTAWSSCGGCWPWRLADQCWRGVPLLHYWRCCLEAVSCWLRPPPYSAGLWGRNRLAGISVSDFVPADARTQGCGAQRRDLGTVAHPFAGDGLGLRHRLSGLPADGILTMTLCTVGLGVFLCRLTRRAGNVWPAALAHGTVIFCSASFCWGISLAKVLSTPCWELIP